MRLKMQEEPSEVISVRIPKELVSLLRNQAREDRRSLSGAMRVALEAYFKDKIKVASRNA